MLNTYMKRRIEDLEASLQEKGNDLNDASKQLVTSFHELESLTDKIAEQLVMAETAKTKLVHADKLSSFGLIVAGIINEFNNPVSCVLTDIESILISAGDSLEPRIKRSLERTLNNAERLRILTKNLNSTVLPEKESTFQDLNLNKVAERIVDLFRPGALRKSIEFSIKLESKPSMILGVESQIEQIMINLLNNSILSIGENGGKIEVVTRVDGSKVILMVRHTGGEIPVESIERIFAAGSPTDPSEYGTNIGMYIVKEIVDKHDGRAQVSQQGKGTLFSFMFPLRKTDQ